MSRSENFARIKEILIDSMSLEEGIITEDASFTDTMGLDSLDLLELITAMEDAFGIVIPDEDFERIHTISDALDELESLGF